MHTAPHGNDFVEGRVVDSLHPFGRMPSVEMPFDARTLRALAATSPAGWVPADIASIPMLRAKPSAICERQEFPTQTNKTRMVLV